MFARLITNTSVVVFFLVLFLLPILILAINQTDKASSQTFSYQEPDSNSGGSRPSDKGGGGDQVIQILRQGWGGKGLQIFFFGPPGLSLV